MADATDSGVEDAETAENSGTTEGAETAAEAEAAVEQLVADRLRVDRADFSADTRFEDPPLDADSLAVVELAEAIDANLGVYVPDEDLDRMETVGDLTAFVREHR